MMGWHCAPLPVNVEPYSKAPGDFIHRCSDLSDSLHDRISLGGDACFSGDARCQLHHIRDIDRFLEILAVKL